MVERYFNKKTMSENLESTLITSVAVQGPFWRISFDLTQPVSLKHKTSSSSFSDVLATEYSMTEED